MKPCILSLTIFLMFASQHLVCNPAYGKIDSSTISMTVKNTNIAELFEMLSRQHHVNILRLQIFFYTIRYGNVVVNTLYKPEWDMEKYLCDIILAPYTLFIHHRRDTNKND